MTSPSRHIELATALQQNEHDIKVSGVRTITIDNNDGAGPLRKLAEELWNEVGGCVTKDNLIRFRDACLAHSIGLSDERECYILDQETVIERMRGHFLDMAHAYYMCPHAKDKLGRALAALFMNFRKVKGLHPRTSMSVALSHEAPLFLLSVYDTAQLMEFMYLCARNMGHEPWCNHVPRQDSHGTRLMLKLQVMEGVILVATCVQRNRHVSDEQFYWVLKMAIRVYLTIISKLSEGDMDRHWLHMALKRNCHSMAWQLRSPRIYVMFYRCFKALWVAAKRMCSLELLQETKESLVYFCNSLEITRSVEFILQRHAAN